MKTIYVIANAEPDAKVLEAWETPEAAENRRAVMHAEYPGMGYYVEALVLRREWWPEDLVDRAPGPNHHSSVPGRVSLTIRGQA